MAFTVAFVRTPPVQLHEVNREVVVDLTFDTSYDLTNGESLLPADVGLNSIDAFIPHGPATETGTGGAIQVRYDYTSKSVRAYWDNSAAAAKHIQVANATNLSAYTVRVTIQGR